MHPSEFCWIVWLMLVTSSAYAEKPKVALKIKNQKEPLYDGDNVTLECSIESDLPNWKYQWHKWSLASSWVNIKDSREGTHTHSVFSYEIELYWCAAVRDDHPYYFEMSNAVTVTVQDKPKATLKMRKPENIGDTLTLNCSFEGGFTGWRYTWLKLNWTGQIDLVNGITGDTYTVQSVTQSDTGVYWCAGERDEYPQYTKLSNAVTLSFQEKPKVTLKMRNQTEFIYEGDDVTLECRIEGALPGWRYRWFESSGNRWKEVTDITGDTYTMKSLSSFDNKQCWCWAVRDDPPDYSEVSNIVTVKVRAGLNMTLKMRNERKPVHIGENVTLECSIERSLPTERYKWRKWSRTDGIRWLQYGDTFLIRSVTHSDSGAYWCYVSSLVQPSNVFLLTVQVTQKVNLKIKNPKVPFYTGDDVTLECSSDSNLSDWTYRWYHWSEAGMWNELKNFTEDTYTLQSVTQSDGGKYWCYAFTDNPLHYTEFSNAVILTVQVDYSTVNEIRIGLSFLVLIVLLVLVSECFWTRVLSACRSAEGDSEGHKVMRVFE